MSDGWAVVLLVGAVTIAFKGLGPVLLGGRQLPPRAAGALSLLAPAVLAALVVTQAFAAEGRLVLDPRAAGLAVAAIAVWRKGPTLLVVVIAAGVTALVRALT